MTNKKRSRASIISYMNKLFKGDIQVSYDNYDKEKLVTHITLEKVIQVKLDKVIICAREAKADIGLPVADYDYDDYDYDYVPGIKCTKLA